ADNINWEYYYEASRGIATMLAYAAGAQVEGRLEEHEASGLADTEHLEFARDMELPRSLPREAAFLSKNDKKEGKSRKERENGPAQRLIDEWFVKGRLDKETLLVASMGPHPQIWLYHPSAGAQDLKDFAIEDVVAIAEGVKESRGEVAGLFDEQ